MPGSDRFVSFALLLFVLLRVKRGAPRGDLMVRERLDSTWPLKNGSRNPTAIQYLKVTSPRAASPRASSPPSAGDVRRSDTAKVCVGGRSGQGDPALDPAAARHWTLNRGNPRILSGGKPLLGRWPEPEFRPRRAVGTHRVSPGVAGAVFFGYTTAPSRRKDDFG